MDMIKSLEAALTKVVLDPKNHDALTLVKGIRNGMVYGAKVRFPHALVMMILFRSGTLRHKLWLVFKATRTHARNLAYFALVYKSALMFLRNTSADGKHRSLDPFISGLLGGYFVFGRSHSSVAQQIVIYVFARVCLGFAKLAVKPGFPSKEWELVKSDATRKMLTDNAWPAFASLSWATVMWLFMWHPEVVQPSLRSSMNYIYVESDTWDSLRNFIWHNK